MSADLGEFEGMPITSMKMILTNTGDGLSQAVATRPMELHIGDPVAILSNAVVQKVRHEANKDDPSTVSRVVIVKADTMTIVDREFASEKLDAQRVANDRAKGIQAIPFPAPLDKGPVVHLDGNFMVMTEAEVAEARGRGETVHEVVPTLVEYDREVRRGEVRNVWPDDYPKGAQRPNVGDENDFGVVKKLLDHTTGEPIDPISEGGLAVGEEEGESADAAATDDGDSPDSDVWEDDWTVPDVDPLVVDFLSQSTADIKLQIVGQIGRQFLDAALAAELNGPNKARPAVVSAIKSQIAGL